MSCAARQAAPPHLGPVPGTVLFALGTWALASWTSSTPAYWRVFFGPQVLIGTGVGMTIATLVAAATAFLPPERYAMGSAFSQTSRQIGAAVGIACLVVLLGEADQDACARVWAYLGAVSLVAGAIMAALYRAAVVGSSAGRSMMAEESHANRCTSLSASETSAAWPGQTFVVPTVPLVVLPPHWHI